MLVTTGGVSVGPHDLVRATLAELGVEEVFWRVAVKPGKPIAFGVRGGTLVFGLPGNPVSSLVGFELFVRPALRALQGARDPRPAFLPGRLARARAAAPRRVTSSCGPRRSARPCSSRCSGPGVAHDRACGDGRRARARADAATASSPAGRRGQLPADLSATRRARADARNDPAAPAAEREHDVADELAQRPSRRAFARRRVRRVPARGDHGELRRACGAARVIATAGGLT